MIYNLLLISADDKQLKIWGQQYQQHQCFVMTNILRVSHQIHDEAIVSLYAHNKAVIPFPSGFYTRRRPHIVRRDEGPGHDLVLRSGQSFNPLGRIGIIHERILRRLVNIEIEIVWQGYFRKFLERDEGYLVSFLKTLITILKKDASGSNIIGTTSGKSLCLSLDHHNKVYGNVKHYDEVYSGLLAILEEKGIFRGLQALRKVRSVLVKGDIPAKYLERLHERLTNED